MALIGTVKRNGGGSGKRIKRDTGTHCNSTCSCVWEFVCVWGGMDFLLPTKLSLSDHPPIKKPPQKITPPIHSLSYILYTHFRPPAPRPRCEIHHVLTPHYPQHIFRQRDDESRRSPLFQVGTTAVSKMVVTPSVCVMMSFPAVA